MITLLQFIQYFGKNFYGGLYKMPRQEVEQYLEFFNAVATMQTGWTPEQTEVTPCHQLTHFLPYPTLVLSGTAAT